MKIKLLLLFSLLCMSSYTKEKVIVYLYDIAPVVIVDDGPDGFIPELLNDVFKNADLEPEYRIMPGLRAFKSFKEGKGLIVTAKGIIKDINTEFIPLIPMIGGFFGKDKKVKVKNVSYRRPISRAAKMIEKHGYNPMPVANFTAAVKMLQAKRVERVLGINLPLNYIVKKEEPQCVGKIKLIGKPTHTDVMGLIGLSSDKKLFAKLKKALEVSMKNGSYDKAFSKFVKPYLGQFSENDYRIR